MVIKIPIHGGHFAMVDEESMPLIDGYLWYLFKNKKSGHVYAQGYHPITKKYVLMHRVIMGCTKRGEWVDHKNNIGLDNTLANLRKCTPSQNLSNKTSAKNSSSQFLGVALHPCGKWIAQIGKYKRNGKKVEYLGLFEEERDAAIAYNERAKILHGEFAKLNLV